MELNKIERLLERYDEGQTSLKEEEQLRKYFLHEEVPAHLKPYQMMFTFSTSQRNETFSKKVEKEPEKSYRFTWASIAAILIVAVGLYFFDNSSASINQNDLGTITDEELALEKTKETLAMVSQIMNEGKADLVYLKEFNNTKNRIIEID